MENKFRYDVFLSHNSADKKIVRIIAKKLNDSGLKVWFDEWVIKPGDNICLEIEKGLEESKILILFISKKSMESNWVALERSTAIFRDPTNKNRRFIPLLIEDCIIPDSLKIYKYISYKSDSESSVKELINICYNVEIEYVNEVYNESINSIDYKECPSCYGKGTCPSCYGEGNTTNVLRTIGATIFTAGIVTLLGGAEKDECKICDGTGKCNLCKGKGYLVSNN